MSTQAEPNLRETTVTWGDPAIGLKRLPHLDGIEFLQKIADGEIPAAPIGAHIGMEFTEVEPGKVTFTCHPDESHYNPIGMVHGGLVCTLLDSVVGCAAHSLLPAGMGYTSIDINVGYLRPVTADSGPLVATGRVTKPGRRVTFAEGEVVDAAGKTVATTTSSLLVFPLETA
ncbi:PaaI family thioesterase [Brevibacterium limosum]|uniref:PaaI family thioesterase n=1 Tax=Brevibacterium limosum TaxID=2697565 RepID=UPI001424011F|nr:PaaI family thioesterase [Brevibacterium limosum]